MSQYGSDRSDYSEEVTEIEYTTQDGGISELIITHRPDPEHGFVFEFEGPYLPADLNGLVSLADGLAEVVSSYDLLEDPDE